MRVSPCTQAQVDQLILWMSRVRNEDERRRGEKPDRDTEGAKTYSRQFSCSSSSVWICFSGYDFTGRQACPDVSI